MLSRSGSSGRAGVAKQASSRTPPNSLTKRVRVAVTFSSVRAASGSGPAPRKRALCPSTVRVPRTGLAGPLQWQVSVRVRVSAGIQMERYGSEAISGIAGRRSMLDMRGSSCMVWFGGMAQPLRPWMLMPSTRFFWKKKKRIMTGTSDRADMAKVAP